MCKVFWAAIVVGVVGMWSTPVGAQKNVCSNLDEKIEVLTARVEQINALKQALGCPVCGNGVAEGGEACDDGNGGDTDTCKTDCTANTCGDGVVNIGVEQCEDGNSVSGDGCSATCQFEAASPTNCPGCGNEVVEGLETCDDGNLNDGDGCSVFCQIEVCGNGITQAGEQCDDGNFINGDGCSTACRFETASPTVCPGCGNGEVEGLELCDDGNTVSGDGCSEFCRIEVCGNGIVDAGEQCDDGSIIGNGCSAACQCD